MEGTSTTIDPKKTTPKPDEKNRKNTNEPTPEEARAQEREKLHNRMTKLETENSELLEKLNKRDGDISELLKKQQEKEEELARARKAEEDQKAADEAARIAEAREKDEAVATLFDKSEQLIKNLTERIELAERTGSEKVEELKRERDAERLRATRLSVIQEFENGDPENPKPLIHDLVTGSTEEELRASAENAHKRYMQVRGSIIEKEGMEPTTPSVPDGHTTDTLETQVPSEVRKLATSPRFKDDKDFNAKMGAFRSRDKALADDIAARKALIFGEYRKRGIE